MSPGPFIPTITLISTEQIPKDPQYQDLRIVRFQSNEQAQKAYSDRRYSFQHDVGQHELC